MIFALHIEALVVAAVRKRAPALHDVAAHELVDTMERLLTNVGIGLTADNPTLRWKQT